MRSLLLAMTACTALACVAPAQAAMVVPAVITDPVATPSPMLQNVWWDRWHHWHHRHWHHHWHRYPR